MTPPFKKKKSIILILKINHVQKKLLKTLKFFKTTLKILKLIQIYQEHIFFKFDHS